MLSGKYYFRHVLYIPYSNGSLARAIAAKGGVIQVTFYSGFLDKAYWDATQAAEARLKPQTDALREKYKDDDKKYWAEAEKLWKAEIPAVLPVDALIDHIDHFVKVAGVDHVGLGSDFDGISSTPQGIDSAADLPNIVLIVLDTAREYGASLPATAVPAP